MSTQLLRTGRRLAVLGVKEGVTGNEMRWWHVVRPGSYSIPQVGTDLTRGRSYCGYWVVTNGYAADFRPGLGVLCPACAEQI